VEGDAIFVYDEGEARVSVTNALIVDNSSGQDAYEAGYVGTLGYNVTILAAMPAGG
jgi:hypothetical protein